MASSNRIDVVKLAIEICTYKRFMKNVYLMKSSDEPLSARKRDFEQFVENEAFNQLENYELDDFHLDRVMGTVFAIAIRTLAWLVYYERTFDIPREYSIHYLDRNSYTEVGILDEGRMAQQLIREPRVSAEQKFQIASVYCFKQEIPSLFRRIKHSGLYNEITMEKDMNMIQQPPLVIFWTYFTMGEVNKVLKNKTIDECRFDMAIKSGSKPALVYCLDKTSMGVRTDQLVNALRDILIMIVKGNNQKESNFHIDEVTIFLGKERSCQLNEMWIPNHCFTDMLYFLLPKMSSVQIKAGFSKFFASIKYGKELQNEKSFELLRGLEFLFRWPHQEHFMSLIRQLWDVLPEKIYSYFLLQICDKIEPSPFSILYGEEKYLEHRNLLMIFWQECPNNFKRYVFSVTQSSPGGNIYLVKIGLKFLAKLLCTSKFNEDDKKRVKIILSSLTSSEKKNFITSKETIKIFKAYVKMNDYETFHELISICFDSEEEALCFKRSFIYFKVKHDCLEFVKQGKWKDAEALLNSYELSEKELVDIKQKVIRSKRGKEICLEYFLKNKQISDRFIEWCFETEEGIQTFKKELIFSYVGLTECKRYIEKGSLEQADNLANWCLSEMDIDIFKQTIANEVGIPVCQSLIFGTQTSDASDRSSFKGPRWQEAETFLCWCCRSEENVLSFKRRLYCRAGGIMLFRLVERNLWEETENFFKWLKLPEDAIKYFKKRTFFDCTPARFMFEDLMKREEGDEKFKIYGSKKEAIEKLLFWYLTDMDAVIEFRNRYRCYKYNEIIRQTIAHLRTKYKKSVK